MNTVESAPWGAELQGLVDPRPLLKAETLLVPDKKLVIPTDRLIDFDKSDPLEPETMKLLEDPRVGYVLVPLAAKCNWRVPHVVLATDMLVAAARKGELKKAGFSFTDEEFEDLKLSVLLHDTGFAYTSLPSEVLNPKSKYNLKENNPYWEATKMHPNYTMEILEENGFSPYVVYEAGNHHNYGEDAYGGDAINYDPALVKLPDARTRRLVSWIDVPQAAADERRRYKDPSDRAAIETIMRKAFIGKPGKIPDELQIPESLLKFFTEAAFDRRRFEMPATDAMDAFAQKVIHTPELWNNPRVLPQGFAQFA